MSTHSAANEPGINKPPTEKANSRRERLTGNDLEMHIKNCGLNNRGSQKLIYMTYYGYAKAICDHYTNNPEDLVEIINDGFLKIFKHIHRFKPSYADLETSFKGWFGKIMTYTAIDHFRKNRKKNVRFPSLKMDLTNYQLR